MLNQAISTKRVILGIDPGFDRMGWAVGEVVDGKCRVLGFDCVQTNKKQSLSERYQQINDALTVIIATYHPTEAAIESLFFTKNQTSAMHVAEARGVIISCLFRHDVPYAEYAPLQIKQAVTGFGKADKAAVEKMIRMQLKLMPSMTSKGKSLDDALDALAIFLTHASRRY